MERDGDIVLRISPERLEIVLEQQKEGGVTARKNISPEALAGCILGSRYDEEARSTGLLPEGCTAAVMEDVNTTYFIRCPDLYADISYYGTEYLHFPIPRLVFGFQYLGKEGKVGSCRLCVVKDGRLTADTPTYHYPFSNVSCGDGHICTGNNALPAYSDPLRLHTLMGYILRLPNNNDHFLSAHNRPHLGYRDLLELMKDKTPGFYYSDVLVEDGKTLKTFLNGR